MGAPPALRERSARYLAARPGGTDPATELAGAATDALAAVLRLPGGRSVALDLLAADALVTLALLARATQDPGGLAAFAATLREAGAAVR